MRILTFSAAVLTASLFAAEDEGRRVALIIGNDSYSISPLRNAVNDARAMDKALQAAKFKTTLKENASKVVMEQAVVDFLSSLGPSDTALFFYAGHALQIQNENVLIPVDFESANSVIDAKYKSVSLAQVFDYLKQQRVKRSIVIVDACRSNPVGEAHSLQGGLAIPPNAGRETYIAFSTSPNSVAGDNPDGKNSWFTEALAEQIGQPGLTLDEVFTKVRQRVEKSTNGRQTPWSQTSLTGRFFFNPPANLTDEVDATLFDKWMADALRQENRGNFTEAAELIQQVLKGKPGGSLEQRAKLRLPYLLARAQAQAHSDAGKPGEAGKALEEAFKADPFAIESALKGASAYLLNDQLTDAVRMLRTMRVRGGSKDIEKANAVLKELAPVLPEAEAELKSGTPQPPPIRELFSDMQFGTPDWASGKRYVAATPVNVSRWLAQVLPPEPIELPIVTSTVSEANSAAQSASTGTIEPHTHAHHIELAAAGATRDLRVRKAGEAAPAIPDSQAAFLEFVSDQGDAAIHFDGRDYKPGERLRVAAGQYEVRIFEKGSTVSTKLIEVKASETLRLGR